MAKSGSCKRARAEVLKFIEKSDSKKEPELQKKIYKYYLKYSKYQKQIYSWPMKVFEKIHSSTVNFCTFSPDGNYLATGSSDKTIKIWNIKDQKEEFTLIGHSTLIKCCSYSPDGNYLATGSSGTVKIWNIKEQREEFTLIGNLQFISCCSYSPDGNYLATDTFNIIIIWNIKEQRQEFTLNKNAHSVICCCSYSPDGKYLATGSSDKTVRIWNIKEQREEFTLNGHSDWVKCCSYSPDGNYLATGSSGAFKIWNVKEQREEFTLIGHLSQANYCSYSTDGNYLATGSSGAFKIWNINERREEFTFIEHPARIKCFSYSPDGNYLAIGSSDKKVKIWNCKEQREELSLNEYSNQFSSCSCSPKGDYVITVSSDYKFQIWKIKNQRKDINLNYYSKVNTENKIKNIRDICKKINYGLFTIKYNYDGRISFRNNVEKRIDFLLRYEDSNVLGLYFIKNEKFLVAVYRHNIFKIAYWNKLLYILNENLSRCIIQRRNIKLLFKDAKVAKFIYNYYYEYDKSKVKIEEQLSLIVSKLLIKFDLQKSPKIALDISKYLLKFSNLNYRIQHLNNGAHSIIINFYSENLSIDIEGIYELKILMFLYNSIKEFDAKQEIKILLDQLIELIS